MISACCDEDHGTDLRQRSAEKRPMKIADGLTKRHGAMLCHPRKSFCGTAPLVLSFDTITLNRTLRGHVVSIIGLVAIPRPAGPILKAAVGIQSLQSASVHWVPIHLVLSIDAYSTTPIGMPRLFLQK
jgi:hypothetical protein